MNAETKEKVGCNLIVIGFLSALAGALISICFATTPVWLTRALLSGAALTFVGVWMVRNQSTHGGYDE